MLTESEIIDGIRKDHFVFFYQPKISLVTGRVYGAEALIRLIRPDGAITAPESFIPVAERSSLIKDITRHMFRKLASDMPKLMAAGPMAISFNASVKDFEDDTLTRMILDTLEASGLAAESLQVELTETATLGAGERVRQNVIPLTDAGVGLAMDDFGRGYSSLDTLGKWPFTAIKLDEGLIARMFDSEKNLTIVETSVRMAHELGVSVVAEGVETSAQYHQLLEVGCTKIQGYWVSKPLPLDQYVSFVKEGTHWSGLPVGLIHMAIIDHVQWRRRIVGVLIRAVALPKESPYRKALNVPPMSRKDCKLGHWYDGVGQMFRERQAFRDLEKPHRELHEIGLSLVRLVADGAGMADIAPGLRKLSECSMLVMDLLHALEIEGMMEMGKIQGDWAENALNPDDQGAGYSQLMPVASA